jgi:HEAT repeat protein
MGCLAAAGHPDALPHLAAGLRGDPDVAMAAMPGFATLGEPGVAALAVLASEDNGELRMRVAQALSFITDGRASTLVAKLAVDPDPAVRAQTLRTVGALRDPSLLHLALDGTSDTRSNVRQAAVEALGQVPSDAALDHLAKLSEGPDRGLAVAAVKAMAGRAEAALPVLVNLVVTKTSARVADEVDRTLTAMGARFPAEITGALTPHLPGPSGQRAAHLMAACGEPGAKVLLDTMSETGYGRQVFFAQRALLARPAEAVGPIEEALAADPREYETPVVSRYLSVLSASGDPSTVATIGKIAADPRDRLRAEAMSSLRPFETAEATELLIGGLQDSWRDVREQSAIILGERKVVAAIPQLAQLIRADDEIILRAIWALGNIGDKSALMDLHAVLHHRRAAVRQYACAALATIGDSSSLIYLIKLIEDEDELVRGQAVRAMSRIE